MTDVNQFKLPPSSDMSDAQVYAYLVRLLAAREQSQAELRRKLLEKGCTSEAIENTLKEAVETNI